MKNIFVVKESEASKARSMEQKLLSLPADSGILFVGIEVVAGLHVDLPIYRVFVGCQRSRDPSLMISIVQRYLREDVEYSAQLIVEARRGLDRVKVTPDPA